MITIGKPMKRLLAASMLLCGGAVHAQLVIEDKLTGASSSFDWQTKNGACLTAGDGTGTIPKCVGLAYYSGKTQVGGTSGRLPDAVGSGALRLSNGDTTAGTNGNNQTGAVVSNFTFPTNEGIQVTWTSVSYGGNNYNGTGADGIAFFLSDGTQSPSIGAFGGSLGYSCANGKDPSDGVVGAYLGVGIDEFGNFANQGDNTDTGQGFRASRISVRGAGSTAWSWLSTNATYKKYYTGAANATAVQKTCGSGYAWNFSGSNKTDSTGASISTGNQTHDKLAYNYPLLYSVDLPANTLANQQAINLPTRGNAVPIIFALKITADGLMDFSYSVGGGATQTVTTGLSITASNGPLPSSFRFGFASGTGGGSNVHEITCFKATPANLANSTAGSNSTQSSQVVIGGSQIFLGYYHPINWWGSMTANLLRTNAAGTTLDIVSTATWDGNCVLTGGTCQAMGTGVSVTAQAPSARTILSWNNSSTGGAGVAFTTGGLTSAEQTAIGSTDRINWIRGDRSKEVTNGGSFRNRTSVLGDIIDSGPTWVGPPASDYADPWKDKTATAAAMPEGSTSYATFASNMANRMNVTYVGANDGMLHGFRAGVVASDGASIANSDGRELIAYVPGQVVNNIHPSSAAFDPSATTYQHNFQVNATPGTGDLYYSGAWHTWLVSGLGPGGHAAGQGTSNAAPVASPQGTLFALDITDPSTFSEANAATLVIGEWTSANLVCVTNATCGTNLGQVYGTPLIRRLHDGSWGVIWGNGLNSQTGRAGIFIMHVSTTGVKTFQYIDAGPGPANGIVEVTAADLDGDHVTDFVYAGDVTGNLWRFDLTSGSNLLWASATQLFDAPSNQPISTAPVVTEIPAVNDSGKPKLLITFGTGQKLPLTNNSAEVYASGTQAVYAIWDASLSAWNATSTDEKYDTITSPTLPIPLSALQARTLAAVTGADGNTYRTILPADPTICWLNSTACGSGNTQMGYKMSLPIAGEQIIYNMTQIDDYITYNTTVPQTSQPLTCGGTPASGFTMTPSVADGGGTNPPFTDGTNAYSGKSWNGAGSTGAYRFGDSTFIGTETRDGSWESQRLPPPVGKITRVTWTRVR